MEVVDYLLGKNSSGGGGGEKYKPKAITFRNKGVYTSSQIQDLQSDLNNIDFSECDCKYLFYHTFSDVGSDFELDLSKGNFKPTTIENMFEEINIEEGYDVNINLNNMDFSSCTNCSNAFKSSDVIKSIQFPSTIFNVAISNFSSMFYNCSSLEEVNIDCLNNLNYSVSTSKTGLFDNMFEGCTSLKKVSMKKLKAGVSRMTAKGSFKAMFKNCTNLEEIEIDNLDLNTGSQANLVDIFTNCGANLPSGQYTKVYVKSGQVQSFILQSGRIEVPEGWTTSNIIVAGSSDDHRND